MELPSALTVGQLAEALGRGPVEVIKELMKHEVMASVSQVVDFDTAAMVATALGHEAVPRPVEAPIPEKPASRFAESDAALLQPRPPVVTIMGHVDHGKTSLLDAIRQSNIIATEAGGITQHIGAYQVEVDGQRITFLDTPGHEAFTAMRARGARATDIAVLVVAADDGVMPQTEEAIDHAQAAGVPIVVAINKIDKPEADPERVKRQLAAKGLLIEEWGGDIVCVSVSAKTHQGISDLLANILVVAEVGELKANPDRPATGVVIEAELDKTRGPTATVLVQGGTLHLSNVVVAGETWGRIKAMFNEHGQQIRKAGPSTPASILGLSGVSLAGDAFAAANDERAARSLAEAKQKEREQQISTRRRILTLDEFYAQVREGKVKELNVILKTDVQGSIDPIRTSLERLSTEGIKVMVLRAASGSITETDVLLAAASKGIIIGFNTSVEPGASRLADIEGVDIRLYDIIYKLTEDVSRALEGMLGPTYADVLEGRAEVRQVFSAGRHLWAAGAYVLEGRIARGTRAKVVRDGKVLAETPIASLRRFKDDVREVAAGFECGIALEGFSDFQLQDVIEFYRRQEVSSGQVAP